MPTVSVVIPAYNAAPFIKDTVESVLAQTYTDYEIIVVNDGSPDTEALEQALASYRDRIVYLKQDNQGPGAARNTAIRMAQVRYIALLDSDDLWAPEYLAIQVEVLERDPTIDVVYPNAIIFGDDARAGKTFMELCPSEGEVTFESLVAERCQVAVAVLARRDTLFRAGLFDPDPSLQGVEDFDLWLRIVKTGGRIAYHRRVLMYYRGRRGSLSSDPVRMQERQLKALDKAARSLELNSSERDALQTARTRSAAHLHTLWAKQAFLHGDFAAAARHLRNANAYFHRPKLAVAGWLMRMTPGLLSRVYNVREKTLSGTGTQF